MWIKIKEIVIKIIAFGHQKNVGKDTAASFVSTYFKIQNPGSRVIKTGFASKIKQISYELYSWAGMQDEEYYELARTEREMPLPNIGKSPRQIWIEVGNKIREIYIDTWLHYPFTRQCDLILFKDLRYMTEVQGIIEKKGLLIKIINPNVRNTDDEADCALNDYDGWHKIIVNDKCLNHFHTNVINAVKDYLNE